MQREFPEVDWRRWRKLSPVALERQCSGVLERAAQFQAGTDSSHERFLKLFRHVGAADEKIGRIFNNQRRSNAYQQLALAFGEGLITREELSGFTADTQNAIALLAGDES